MITKLSHEGLRKAAVLVASLDTAAADAVLDQLTPDEARQVRDLVVEMDDIDQREQRRVIDEFFENGPGKTGPRRSGLDGDLPTAFSPDVELGGRLAQFTARSAEPGAETRAAAGHHVPMVGGQPFRFLQETEADHDHDHGYMVPDMVPALVRVLGSERPQTIALVLAHLAPVRAGAVLARLPGAVQVEVIRRLVDLEETDPAILHEVEEALRSRLSSTTSVEMQRRRVAGLHAVAGILRATDGGVGMQILDNLASRDRALAEKLGPRPLKFDDLADLEEELLAEVFEETGPELMLPALFGAAPELVNRLLARMPQADARAIRHKLDHPGPIRLRDVEEARRQVARIASRLSYRTKESGARS